MPAVGIRVQGLGEFRRDLKAMGPGMEKGVKDANVELSVKATTKARARAQALGSTAAHVAGTIRPIKRLRAAGVSLGNAAHPEALGAEFGSFQYRQFQPWRGNGMGAGYFLYPTIRSMEREVKDTYLNLVIDKVAARAYPH